MLKPSKCHLWMDLVTGFFFSRLCAGPPELLLRESVCDELGYSQGYPLAVRQQLRSNQWSQCGEDHWTRAEGRLAQKFYQQ